MLIKKGDKGEMVAKIQSKLGLNPDGDFGQKTEDAVKAYQKKNKLSVDGLVGDGTLKLMGIAIQVVVPVVKEPAISELQYAQAAKLLGCDVASIKAVDEVEAGGSGFLTNGDIKILFEPHVFWRELKLLKIDPNKYTAGNSDILYEKWKTGSYGKSTIQWDKMNRAMKINKEAALKSASYGRFQIMGNNYKVCGYQSVTEFVKALEESEFNHLVAFINFCKSNRLDRYLITKNWEKFAEGYNGSGYKANRYDEKLLEAYNSFK